MINKDLVYEKLRTVVDPEVGFDIVSLGLIYGVKVEENNVTIDMTLSTKGCPLHELLKQWATQAVQSIENINDVNINIVWTPAWNINMANDEVKKALS